MMRARLGYAFKLLVSHALYCTGLLQAWQAIAMRRSAVVLMYHRVLTADERRRSGSHPALVVDRDTFARQMALLKRRFTVLSIHEFAERLERSVPLPDSSCLITFDDGWKDNVTNALPVLREHGLPALVFLPINYIGSRRLFWQEALTHLLERAIVEAKSHSARREALVRLLAPVDLDGILDLHDPQPRARVLEAVGRQKALPRAQVQALVASLARELNVDLERLAGIDGFIGWDDVALMAQHRISFGGHGVEHLLLTQVSAEECETEIRESKAAVDRRLGERVPTFSYPNGYLTPEIAERVRRAGYRLAFITRRGFVRAGDDPFTVRRINIDEAGSGSMPMFLARMVGLWG